MSKLMFRIVVVSSILCLSVLAVLASTSLDSVPRSIQGSLVGGASCPRCSYVPLNWCTAPLTYNCRGVFCLISCAPSTSATGYTGRECYVSEGEKECDIQGENFTECYWEAPCMCIPIFFICGQDMIKGEWTIHGYYQDPNCD